MSKTRGRRSGGPDTRGEILQAARSSFAHKGFGGTTIRGVATDAGVDPALVHHYFGTKDDLFLAALEIGIDPREIVPQVLAEGFDGAGDRLVRVFLSVWEDPAKRLPLIALVRNGLSSDSGQSLLRDGMVRLVLSGLRDVLPAGEAERRGQLVGTQLIGLIVGRYLLRLEPLASMSVDELAAWVGPTLQRYLDGDI
jgi:AcrR family transcriptional regulator